MNVPLLLAILMAMRMQRYDVEGFTRSHWMRALGECLRSIASAAAMVDKFFAKHKTLPKNYF